MGATSRLLENPPNWTLPSVLHAEYFDDLVRKRIGSRARKQVNKYRKPLYKYGQVQKKYTQSRTSGFFVRPGAPTRKTAWQRLGSADGCGHLTNSGPVQQEIRGRRALLPRSLSAAPPSGMLACLLASRPISDRPPPPRRTPTTSRTCCVRRRCCTLPGRLVRSAVLPPVFATRPVADVVADPSPWAASGTATGDDVEDSVEADTGGGDGNRSGDGGAWGALSARHFLLVVTAPRFHGVPRVTDDHRRGGGCGADGRWLSGGSMVPRCPGLLAVVFGPLTGVDAVAVGDSGQLTRHRPRRLKKEAECCEWRDQPRHVAGQPVCDVCAARSPSRSSAPCPLSRQTRRITAVRPFR